MKRISAFVLFFLISVNYAFSQDTIKVYYDKDWGEISNKNEAIYYRVAFVDSSKTWVAHDYYASNKIQMSGPYKSKDLKSRHGHFIYYYENGQKSSEGQYLNDKREGVWCTWYENGQKKSEGKYIADNYEGMWEYWHENGQKRSEGKYLKDEKDGLWQYWYSGGKMECEETLKKGLLISGIGYFDNGNMSYKGSYSDGKSHGEWTYGNFTGRVVLKGRFNKGEPVGEWKRMFLNEEMNLSYNNGVLVNDSYGRIVRRK